MKVVKRNGRHVKFNPSKITARLRALQDGLKVDTDSMAIKVISQMADGITTKELDTLCIEIASGMVPVHPDYSSFASRLFVTQLRKSTPDSFSEAVKLLAGTSSVLSMEFVQFVLDNKNELDNIIVQNRDFNHDIFGLRTLERSYLLKSNSDEIIERPQYMWMRVAIEAGGFDMNEIIGSYNLMSKGYFTHATPTLFNSGTKLSQLSSCFLLGNKGDSIDGLFGTMKDVAHISKLAGGIGLHVHDVRARGSVIKGTNGKSDGLVPMMRTYNEIARWINQGGKRKGSFAMYLEPWHADIYEFVELKKNHGKEEMRARDLFYAIWMNDLFMERVKNDEEWTLFCPNELLKGGCVLQDVFGEQFKYQYEQAELAGLGRETVRARDLWEKILVSQLETGVPYIGYKDRVNESSNQKNVGTIKSSNLCIEINEYSDENEQAVCNLASIALPKFVVQGKHRMEFDWISFRATVGQAVRNLDNVIDANYYPTQETEISNCRHRPVGLGVQGLADVFAMMNLPFDSDGARELNKDIFEHMYYYALEESCNRAKNDEPYDSFDGSPASKGILQFDMYDEEVELNPDLDWDTLRSNIITHGLRNSLLIALMPTASTSQILGNNECFEPFTSNLYTRGTLSGTHVVINKHLVRDLEMAGLWSVEMKNKLVQENGSVLNIPEIPTVLKERYKTAYEISMKSVIDMAADRQKFVCQSQSMNLFLPNATTGKVNSMHFYAWEKGLKTGMYYLRSKAAAQAKKFSLDITEEVVEENSMSPEEYRTMIQQSRNESNNDEEDCMMCGS